jgi:hypothetical protein
MGREIESHLCTVVVKKHWFTTGKARPKLARLCAIKNDQLNGLAYIY